MISDNLELSPTRYRIYRTGVPSQVSAYQQARNVRIAYHAHVLAEAARLGGNAGPIFNTATALITGAQERLVGLHRCVDEMPPAGWSYVPHRDRLEPTPGSGPGSAAYVWMFEHQPPNGMDPMLMAHRGGLPRFGSRRDPATGTITAVTPSLAVMGGQLWAIFDSVDELPAVTGVWSIARYEQFVDTLRAERIACHHPSRHQAS